MISRIKSIKIDKTIFVPLMLLYLCFLLQATLWSNNIVPGVAPDEPSHFDYISYLYTYQKLPIYGQTEYMYIKGLNAHAILPPLYYILAVPFKYFSNQESLTNQYYSIRMLSVILGLITVHFSFLTAKLLKPNSKLFAIAVSSVVALNPMFTYVSSVINSDNLINTIYAILVYHLTYGLLRLEKPTKKWLIQLGCIIGAGLITKPTIISGIIISGIAIILMIMKDKKNLLRNTSFCIFWSVFPCLIISGWYLIRNLYLYDDLTGVLVIRKYNVFPTHPYQGSLFEMLTTPRGFTYLVTRSFWGVFDAMNIYYSYILYNIFFGMTILGLFLFLFTGILKFIYRKILYSDIKLYILYILLILISIATVINTSLNIDVQPQGRYLFPALLPFTIIMVSGIYNIGFSIRTQKYSMLVIIYFMVIANNIIMFTTLAPTEHRRSLYIITQKYPEQKIYEGNPGKYTFTPKSSNIYSIEILASANKIPNQILTVFIVDDRGIYRGAATQSIDKNNFYGGASYIFNVNDIDFTESKYFTLLLEARNNDINNGITLPFDKDSNDNESIEKLDVDPIIQYESDNISYYIENYPYRLLSYGYDISISIQKFLFFFVPILWIIFLISIAFVDFEVLQLFICTLLIVLLTTLLWSKPDYIWIRSRINTNVVPYSQIEGGSNKYVLADLLTMSRSPFVTQQYYIDPTSRSDLILESTYNIKNDNRSILAMHPTNAITYTIPITQDVKLDTALALDPNVWSPDKGDGVVFQVRVTTPMSQSVLFTRYVDPKNTPQDRTWIPVSVDLGSYKGQTIQLTLMTSPGPLNDARYDWAGWSRPVITIKK